MADMTYVDFKDAKNAFEGYNQINVVARHPGFADGEHYVIFLYPKTLKDYKIVLREEAYMPDLRKFLEAEAPKSNIVISSTQRLTERALRTLNETETKELSDIVDIIVSN